MIANGPRTSRHLDAHRGALLGTEDLYFYDSMARCRDRLASRKCTPSRIRKRAAARTKLPSRATSTKCPRRAPRGETCRARLRKGIYFELPAIEVMAERGPRDPPPRPMKPWGSRTPRGEYRGPSCNCGRRPGRDAKKPLGFQTSSRSSSSRKSVGGSRSSRTRPSCVRERPATPTSTRRTTRRFAEAGGSRILFAVSTGRGLRRERGRDSRSASRRICQRAREPVP